MSFITGAVLDAQAAELWRRYSLSRAFDAEALLDDLELSLLWEALPDGDGKKVFGALKARERIVVLNQTHLSEFESNPGLKRFTVGHEVGHWRLHADAARSGTIALDPDGRIWCRSGSREQTERQAEMFAARLLLPEDLVRKACSGAWNGWPNLYDYARSFEVTATAMIVRLEELGLAHRDESGVPRSGRPAAKGQSTLFPD